MTKIINRFTGNLICEEALLNIRETAEKNKDYLEEANLKEADLRGANLWGAKIACKKIVNYKEVSGIGNLRRQLRCFILEDGSLHFIAGCFSGTETELLSRVKEKYGDDCEYIDAINFLKQISIKYPWK